MTLEERLNADMNAKMQAQAAQQYNAGAIRGGMGLGSECKTPLIDLVIGQMQSSEYQGAKAVRLRELAELLTKNPEVARILELMDEVRR